MGRKSKLPTFLEAMKEVLQDKRTVILTDLELLTAVNHRLPKKDKVGISTFEFWKTPTNNKKSPENIESIDDDMVQEFREILAYARVEQKLNLTDGVLDSKSKNAWGSTWVLERKFKDLQIRKEREETIQPLIQITASNNDHKKLIQNILDGESIHLQPIDEVVEEVDYIEVIDTNVEPQKDDEQ